VPLKCSEHERKRSLDYYYRNRDRILAAQRKKYKEDSVFRRRQCLAASQRHKRRLQADPEYNAERLRILRERYSGRRKVTESSKRSKRLANRRYVEKVRKRIFSALGNACACCAETREAFLTLDHIHRDGAKDRKRLGRRSGHGVYRGVIREGIPKDRYRLLCMNCNWATRNGEACPHTLEANLRKI